MSASHLQAEPKSAPRPIYFAAPDADGCIKAPNTNSVFMALWGMRYNTAAVRIGSQPLGPILRDLNEAESLWWVEARLFERGLLQGERLARYEWDVAAMAARPAVAA